MQIATASFKLHTGNFENCIRIETIILYFGFLRFLLIYKLRTFRTIY